jgi:hypothetical protein
MKLVKTKRGYFPLCYPYELKSTTLSAFFYGEGWVKIKNAEIVEGVELPERCEKLSFLEIGKLGHKYGGFVANVYMDTLVPTLVAWERTQTEIAKYSAFVAIFGEEEFSETFYNAVVLDGFMSVIGESLINPSATDKELSEIDPEYDHIACTYKGAKMSLGSYVLAKYGEKYLQVLNKLNE